MVCESVVSAERASWSVDTSGYVSGESKLLLEHMGNLSIHTSPSYKSVLSFHIQMFLRVCFKQKNYEIMLTLQAESPFLTLYIGHRHCRSMYDLQYIMHRCVIFVIVKYCAIDLSLSL